MQKDNDNCDKKNFKRPVSWLLGRELLAGLKWIVAYTFMGDKLDPKDWMNTQEITPPRINMGDKDSYWFDYIADTGDGMIAVYNIAYLCMSDLWVDSQSSTGEDKVALVADATCTQMLPRGEFLFVGGDTAYHIADVASLKERFQTPFNCAYQDISKHKDVDQRPIYGIPANHDYYDALDGFNRQFCKPITNEAANPLLNDPKDPQLGLKGFIRKQQASYVALDLPFKWKLWGFDAQGGKMDKRQQAFFVSLFYPKLLKNSELFNKKNRDQVQKKLQDNVPSKLIIATPEPSTVFGQWADPDAGIVKTFKKLGLEPSFLKSKNGDLSAKEKCRLDISGDIHHYERYWGSSKADRKPTNYASVVAGGGGAFFHPSHTDVNEIKKQAIYPPRKDSHVLITQAILKPWEIFNGGFVWLAGAFIAFMSYFAVTIPQSTWSLFKLISEDLRPDVLSLKLLSKIRIALDDSVMAKSIGCCSSSYFYDLTYIVLFTGFLVFWLWRAPKYFSKTVNSSSHTTTITNSDPSIWKQSIWSFMWPVIVGFLPLLFLILRPHDQAPHSFLSAGLVNIFFIASMLLFGLSRRYSDVLIERSKQHCETRWDLWPLWVLNLLGVTYVAFGFLCYGIYASSVMTFDMLIIIIWSLATVGLVALAYFVGGHLLSTTGKFRFIAIGLWHAILQVGVPVCLVLYTSWSAMLIISVATIGITLLAGYVFSHFFLGENFTLEDQEKLGKLLFAAWGIVGICVLLSAGWGDPYAVTGLRLLAAFVLGALFSCIWFGWYLAVSIAFHGHNNEAGGGSRSESYRHMIRFKLTKNTLTGYVIGIDEPVTDFASAEPPKFRLVDVFTIQASDKATKKTAKGKR